MEPKVYYVYITTNRARIPLYTGVTNDLTRRIQMHKDRSTESYTKQYHLDRLVYFEVGEDINSAIAREKQIKRWRREKKMLLINKLNPQWRDLFEDIMKGKDVQGMPLHFGRGDIT